MQSPATSLESKANNTPDLNSGVDYESNSPGIKALKEEIQRQKNIDHLNNSLNSTPENEPALREAKSDNLDLLTSEEIQDQKTVVKFNLIKSFIKSEKRPTVKQSLILSIKKCLIEGGVDTEKLNRLFEIISKHDSTVRDSFEAQNSQMDKAIISKIGSFDTSGKLFIAEGRSLDVINDIRQFSSLFNHPDFGYNQAQKLRGINSVLKHYYNTYSVYLKDGKLNDSNKISEKHILQMVRSSGTVAKLFGSIFMDYAKYQNQTLTGSKDEIESRMVENFKKVVAIFE